MNHSKKSLTTYLFVFICALCSFQLRAQRTIAEDTLAALKAYQQGNQLAQEAKYEEAAQVLETAIATYKKYELWTSYFKAQNALNKVYWRSGKPKESLSHAEALLKECRSRLGQEKSLEEAVILENMGVAYGMRGHNYLSMRYFEMSLRLRRKFVPADDPSLGKLAHNIGIAKRNEGHYDEALEYLLNAVQIKEKSSKNRKDLISTYNVLSIVYIYKHEYERGQEYAQKALEIARDSFGENNPQTADAYQRLGIAYHYEGEHKKALDFLHKAEALMLVIYKSKHPYLAAIYNNIAEAYLEDGIYDKAFTYFEKALAISKLEFGEQNPKTLAVYNNLGEVYHRQKKSEKAIEYFQKALNEYLNAVGPGHPDLANIYNLLGQQYADLQQYDKALWAFQHALMGNVNHFEDSSVYVNPVWSDTLKYSEGNILISSLLFKGTCAHALYRQYKKKEDLMNAYQALKLALRVLEATEHSYTHKKDKAILLSTEQSVYRRAIEVCLELATSDKSGKYLQEAFNISERDKSVLLMESLQQDDALAFGGVPDSLRRKEKTLRVDIANYRKKLSDAKSGGDAEQIKYYEDILFELDREEDAVLKQIESNYPKYHQFKYESKVLDIAQFEKKVLDDSTALLEYFVSDSVVYIFALDKQGLRLIPVEMPDLNSTVRSFRQVLTQASFRGNSREQDYDEFVRTAHLLYERLVASVALNNRIKRLIIVPDALLNHIPFEVLLYSNKVPRDRSFKKLDYLLKHYYISYSYSAILLQESRENPIEAPNHKILAFAPAYSEADAERAKHRNTELQKLRSSLADLPGAREEVRALEGKYKGEFFYAETAKEAEFRKNSEKFGIIHLAMHGKLNIKNPTESGLVFSEAGDSVHDNVLYAYEINNLPMKAELVVLSACETGYGRFENGEGVMSIARSFMYAGTQSLLMTLWTVNDEATKELMIYFYQNLKKGMAKDVALQRAKLEYLANASGAADHPYLWAGFVALGDIQPLSIKGKGINSNWIWFLSATVAVAAIGALLWRRIKD